jgi:hypothetical protein
MMGKAARLPPCVKQSGATHGDLSLAQRSCLWTGRNQGATTAYEEVLRALRLKDRADPATETIAKKIIELAQRGERDPIRLRERAIRCLSE